KEPCAQWMPMPTKSANVCVAGVPGLSPAAWIASGEPAPKTVAMSIPVFSRIVFAAPTAPKSHPARVKGTHGAGATLPFSLIIVGAKSVWAAGGNGGPVGSKSAAVQYANDPPVRLVPAGVK